MPWSGFRHGGQRSFTCSSAAAAAAARAEGPGRGAIASPPGICMHGPMDIQTLLPLLILAFHHGACFCHRNCVPVVCHHTDRHGSLAPLQCRWPSPCPPCAAKGTPLKLDSAVPPDLPRLSPTTSKPWGPARHSAFLRDASFALDKIVVRAPPGWLWACCETVHHRI